MSKELGPAMEFLITYGWAIFVILTAIATLSYFGAFDSIKESNNIIGEQNCSIEVEYFLNTTCDELSFIDYDECDMYKEIIDNSTLIRLKKKVCDEDCFEYTNDICFNYISNQIDLECYKEKYEECVDNERSSN